MPEPAVLSPRRYSVAEYFEIEYSSEQKHEYRDGEIVDMAGGSESHSLITSNVIGELRNRLRDTPCRVYDSNLRVQIHRTVRYVYPDAFVVCGPREFAPDDPRQSTIINPRVIIEVLSPSTELSDRSDKFGAYIRCPALAEYVMISQREARVETYHRQGDGTWSFAFFEGTAATARLRSLNIDLPLSEVYNKVEFPPAVEAPTPPPG